MEGLPRAEELTPKVDGAFAGWTYLGPLSNRFLVCQGAGGLQLLDRHAAQQRVLFEELRDQFERGHVRAQRLLFPMQVNLSQQEGQRALVQRELLLRVGFDVEPFGGADYVLSAAPAALGDTEPLTGLKVVLGALPDSGEPSASQLNVMLGALACCSATGAGQSVSPQEVRELLQRLEGLELTSNCEHHGAVLVSWPLAEVARWFTRR